MEDVSSNVVSVLAPLANALLMTRSPISSLFSRKVSLSLPDQEGPSAVVQSCAAAKFHSLRRARRQLSAYRIPRCCFGPARSYNIPRRAIFLNLVHRPAPCQSKGRPSSVLESNAQHSRKIYRPTGDMDFLQAQRCSQVLGNF